MVAFFRPWLATVALLTACDVALTCLIPSIGSLRLGPYLAGLAVSAIFWGWLSSIARLLPRHGAMLFAVFMGVGLSLLVLANASLLYYMGDYLTAEALRTYGPMWASYLKSYGSPASVAGLCVIAAFVTWLWWPRGARYAMTRQRGVALAVLPLVLLVSLHQLKFYTRDSRISLDAQTLMAFRTLLNSRHGMGLHTSVRSTVSPPPAADQRPPDIVVILNESLGKWGVPPYDDEHYMDSFAQWIAKEPDSFFAFHQAFANGTFTEISIATLFTGVAGFRTQQHIHAVPLLWSWAKAAGHRTILVTSHRYEWANMYRFVSSPPPDVLLSASRMQLPIVNNTGVDDLLAAERLVESIRATPVDQPLFALFQTHSTHVPYQQQSSVLDAQPDTGSRLGNALTILDHGFRMVYEVLAETGRLDNTIVFITSDHGNDMPQIRRIHRHINFYDEVANVPFIVRIPATIREQLSEETRWLRDNTQRNVTNLDILPTMAHFLGLNEDVGNQELLAQLDGVSLLGKIPDDRTIAMVNASGFRGPKGYAGFGLYRQQWRFLCTTAHGIRLYNVHDDPEQRQDLWPSAAAELRQSFLDFVDGHGMLQQICAPVGQPDLVVAP